MNSSLVTGVTVFDQHADEYDRWFDEHEHVYQAEIEALRAFMPSTGLGVEVGVGTGRFAVPLRIRIGVEPAKHMALLAKRRGVEVVQALGERLPFRDGQFDLVLLVTVVCFVDDVPILLRELNRVLKPGGHLIIGFINRNSEIGRLYESRKEASHFYQGARFYAVEEVAGWVKAAGFDSLQFCQTLFGHPDDLDQKNLEVREGCGEGVFTVLRAEKQ
jgi:SAM-dependent methyltransferase